MAVHESKIITVSIDRDWRQAYEFACVPQNFSRWAAGLGSGLERSGEEWTARDPEGRTIRIRFSPPNEYGVLDHVVVAEDGTEIPIPLRIVPNGTGAEVIFVLYRLPGISAAAFEADAAAVTRDLEALKGLLENAEEAT
jgi:hypothetical protein